VAGALALLTPPGVRSLLDVGSGDGRVAAELASTLGVAEVRGVDVTPRAQAAIDVAGYDGTRLPFPDHSIDAVILSDVLHHTRQPEALLRECLRVAASCVLLKDHFAFGAASRKLLWLMDRVGNSGTDVEVPGDYLELEQWLELAARAGGRFAAIRWPLRIHDLPWRVITRSELQFAARIEHNNGGRA
jgi:SAM-dependent methyltransferase